MDAWVDRYEKSHQNPINRVFHTFPMIAVSIPLFLIAPLVRGFWKIPLSLFSGSPAVTSRSSPNAIANSNSLAKTEKLNDNP